MTETSNWSRRKILSGIGIFATAIAANLCLFSPFSSDFLGRFLSEPDSGPWAQFTLQKSGDLVFLEESANKQRLVVADGEPSTLHVFTSDTISGQSGSSILNIQQGQTPVIKRLFGNNSFGDWCICGETVYFIDSTVDVKNLERNGPPDVTYTNDLWHWTKKDGFRVLFKSNVVRSGLGISPDQKCLYFKEHISEDQIVRIFTYSLADGKVRTIKTDIDGRPFMIDQNRFFVLRDHDPAQLFDVRVGKSRVLGLDGFIVQMASHHDELWALRYLKGKYEVIRLSKDLQSVERILQIPASFPKGIPPDDGMHG